jgi:hypothetical protein
MDYPGSGRDHLHNQESCKEDPGPLNEIKKEIA